MNLSKKNVLALLLDLNEDVDEYAEATVKNIIEDKNFDFLTYPPNNGLTDLEKQELNKLDNNEHLKNALRKVLADNSAGIIFGMLNLLDGTSSPKNCPNTQPSGLRNIWCRLPVIKFEESPNLIGYYTPRYCPQANQGATP